jgi:hypothetical protein
LNVGVAVAMLVAEAAAQQRTAPAEPIAPPAQPRELVRPPKPVTTNLPGRTSPPQPQQEQSLAYFRGTWSFNWIGRESALGAGPRSGTVTFSPAAGGSSLTMSTEGVSEEDASSFKESGTVEWNPSTKTLTILETLANGLRLTSTGDWSSPIAIKCDSQPVSADGQQVRLRRKIDVISGTSFAVTDEISSNGGPFMRLGTGTFRKN